MKRPFLLFTRGAYWYFRLADDKTFHTTGQKSRSKAEAFVVELHFYHVHNGCSCNPIRYRGLQPFHNGCERLQQPLLLNNTGAIAYSPAVVANRPDLRPEPVQG